MAAYAALVSLSQTTDLNKYDYEGKYLFPIKAQGIIRSIHDYAGWLQSVLEKFPEKVRCWEGRIRDLAHEAENLIEYFILLKIQTFHEGVALPDLGRQLENAAEKLGLIAAQVMEEDQPAVTIPAVVSSSSSRLAPTSNDAVIGLDDDVTKIRDRLCGEPSSKLQVIPIVGMAGIGKTTLATTLYNHASDLQYFDFRAWITVSQDYNTTHSLRKILLGLLESMNLLEEVASTKKLDESEVDDEERGDLYKKLEKVDVSEMQKKVFQYLKYRRYLIVLDDVWSTQVWDDVRNIFPDDGNGSRIMLTTRLADVGVYADCSSPLHEMRVMNDAQSWNLLKQMVFTNGDCLPHLQGIGEEIAKSCAGLPLTVVLVAGLLSTVNNTRASWEEIAKNVNSVVGKELDGILSLSYMHLPHHLRPSFLYLGGFPEDERIRAATLIKLWVAEGFVKSYHKSLEEEAEEYLEDFVKRNLVIVNSRKSDGRIKSCSLHDMVRDLCLRKAHQEKFLRVMDGRVVDSRERIDLNEQRRFSFVLSDMDRCLREPTAHTILSFSRKNYPNLLEFLASYKLLRVFHDTSVSSKRLSPQVFHQLFHLRYLALVGRLKITSGISNLVNLQTLIILPIYHYVTKKDFSDLLPLEIWRMPQLRHLIFLEDQYKLPHPPEGLKPNLPLVNLQTLSLIRNLVWSEKMVEMIPNVKTLGLVYTSHQECNLHYLKELLQLEKLQVHAGYMEFFWIGQYCHLPTTLKKLILVGGGYPWKNMSIIGSLPNLQVLKLRDNACYGETWETGEDEFPQLKYLLIEKSVLWQWTMQSSSFRVLKRLVLRCCQYLETIPEEIGEIEELKDIEVRECRESVVESANNIKEFKQREADDDAFQVRIVELQKKIRPSTWFPLQLHAEEQGEQLLIEESSYAYNDMASF